MEALHGLWSPKWNNTWPRLILLSKGRGFFEDGDAPIIYSVLHFTFEVKFGRILACSDTKLQILSDDRKRTEWQNSKELYSEYEFNLETFPDSLDALITFVYMPYPFQYRQYKLVSREVDPSYSPQWKLR